MEIDTRREENAIVVTVKGRLDAVTSPDFEKELTGLISEGGKVFIIDLGELHYISSAGLRSILATTKKLKEKEGKLLLASIKDVVKEVFEISGFGSIIPIYESTESALKEI